MRAVLPDRNGVVDRDGVGVYWERSGTGDPPLLFLVADPIVESRMWKAQVPWFARTHTVVTFDPRGNGRSDRPADSAAYTDDEFVADAVAVLDAADVASVVVIALCQSAGVALGMAGAHPERVAGVVAINPGLYLSPPHVHRAPGGFDNVLDTDEAWAKENRHYWLRDWVDYSEFFFAQMLPERHSTKQREDCVGWALGAGAATMLAYRDQPPGARHHPTEAEEVCRSVRCPVLVINGDHDVCQPPERSRRVAELTGGELVVLEGAGHLPNARDPVRVNLEISRFLRRC